MLMRGGIAFLACLPLAAVLAASATATQVPAGELHFTAPAQADGALTLTHASWVLVVLDDAQQGQGSFDLPRAAEANHTVTWGDYRGVFGTQPLYPVEPDPTPRDLGDVKGNLAFAGQGRKSMWIEADDIQVATTPTPATLAAQPRGMRMADLHPLEDVSLERAARERNLGDAGAAVVVPSGQVSVTVVASGVHRIELFGAHTACTTPSCPGGGGRWGQEASTPIGETLRLATYAYVETATMAGHADLQAVAHIVLAGGPGLDLDVKGWARLPLAAPPRDCVRCIQTDNRTLWATGNLTLSDLQYQGQDALSAEFSGDVAAARLDELAADTNLLAGLPVAAQVGLVATTGILGTSLLAFALFTRYSRSQALENPRRAALYDYVVQNPGIAFRELVRGSGVAAGTARYHLTVLIRSGLLVEKSHHNFLRFFENHGKYEANWAHVGLLRDDALRDLHDWLSAHGPLPQKDILNHWEAQGWSRSTTQHRLGRLVHDGVLALHLRGRYKIYATRPTVQASSPGMPAMAPRTIA